MDIKAQPKTMQSIGEIIKNSGLKKNDNVNNVNKDINNNVTTFNVNVPSKEREAEAESVALNIAEKLNDLPNLNFYRKCAREHQSRFLYECLSITLLAKRENKINTAPAKYFVGVFKRRSIKK